PRPRCWGRSSGSGSAPISDSVRSSSRHPQLPVAASVRHDLRRVRLGGGLLRGGKFRRAPRRHLEAGRDPLAMPEPRSIAEVARETPVVGQSDVLVVGGGAAGTSAAVAAARSGATVTLVERYAHLGGMASGGMVLVLDDLVNGDEVTTTGIVRE